MLKYAIPEELCFLIKRNLLMIIKRGFKYNNLMLKRTVLEPTGRSGRNNFHTSSTNNEGDEEIVEWIFNNQIYVLTKTFLRSQSTKGSFLHFKSVLDSVTEKSSLRILEYVQYAVDTTSQALQEFCFKNVSDTTNRQKFVSMLECMLQSSFFDAVVYIIKNSGYMTANHLKQQTQYVHFLIDHCHTDLADAFGGKKALLMKDDGDDVVYPFSMSKFKCGTPGLLRINILTFSRHISEWRIFKNQRKAKVSIWSTGHSKTCVLHGRRPQSKNLPDCSLPLQFAIHDFSPLKEAEPVENNGNEQADDTVRKETVDTINTI